MREKGTQATVLTSVQGGTWPLAVGAAGRCEGGLGRKDVPALPPFSISDFIFLRFTATLSLSSSELPPSGLKGKCGNVPRL